MSLHQLQVTKYVASYGYTHIVIRLYCYIALAMYSAAYN